MNVFDITSGIRLSARFVFEECFDLDFVLAEMFGIDSSALEFLVCGLCDKPLCHGCCDVLS